MTTPKPLPADIEDALEKYDEAHIQMFVAGADFTEQDSDRIGAAREKLTALLSGYVEDAMKWRTGPPDDFFDAAPVEPEEGQAVTLFTQEDADLVCWVADALEDNEPRPRWVAPLRSLADRIEQSLATEQPAIVRDANGDLVWDYQKNAPMTEQSSVSSNRGWAEDFSHENGMYQNRCHACGNTFLGHKRRVTCKLCAEGEPESEFEKALNVLAKMVEPDPMQRDAAREEVREILSPLSRLYREAVAQRDDLADSMESIADIVGYGGDPRTEHGTVVTIVRGILEVHDWNIEALRTELSDAVARAEKAEAR